MSACLSMLAVLPKSMQTIISRHKLQYLIRYSNDIFRINVLQSLAVWWKGILKHSFLSYFKLSPNLRSLLQELWGHYFIKIRGLMVPFMLVPPNTLKTVAFSKYFLQRKFWQQARNMFWYKYRKNNMVLKIFLFWDQHSKIISVLIVLK